MNRDKLTDATIKVLTESLLKKKQEAKETNRVQDMVELGYTFDKDLENKMLDYCTGVVGRKQDVIEELKNEPVLITPELEKVINETRGDIIYVLFIALNAQIEIDKIDTIILGLSGNKVIDKKVGNFQKDIEPKQETKLVEDEKENNSWFGVEGAKYISRGSWSDPQVSYKGYLYNYWDISDFVYECMVEDYRESGKELPAENTPEYEELFNEYMEKEVPNALFDLQPQELDPSVMDFIEYGQQIRGVVDLIKFADKIVKGYSLEAIEKRLEVLKEITNIPDNLIDKAISLVKDTIAGTDMEDSFDEDERTDEILPMIEEILSNTDTLFEDKQIKLEDKEEFTTNLKNAEDNPVWVIGDITYNGEKYRVNAKVFLDGSEYGIDDGPVSILWVGKPTTNGYGKSASETIISYSRQWDIEPTAEYKDLYEKILNAVVEFRNDHPYEIDEQSEDISEEENL